MKDSIIKITEAAAAAIKADAVATFPNECCGFMYGMDGKERLITEVQPVINSKVGDQRRRFEISPLDYLKAERYALEKGIQLLGVYHSHPNHPAIASEHDLAKALPFFSYVIVSVMEGVVADVKSWKLNEATLRFAEEKVKLLETTNQTI